MAISLKELKQQREQIQKHLDWLDVKIAELELIEPKIDAGKPAVPLTVATPQVEAAASNAPADPKPEEATETPARTEPVVVPALVHMPDIEAPTYQAKTQGAVRRAKIGCFVLFILGISLFLFLLFGLPYLL
jgi:hypothetical protein